MDIQPVNNGHVLVVPREHYESLLEVPEELGMHLFKVTMRLANAVRNVTGCDDLNIVVNSGAAAGQDEPHYHVHIIPRREGDGFDIPLPFNGSEMPDRTVLDAYAARIIVGAARSDEARIDGTSRRAGVAERRRRKRVVALATRARSQARCEPAVRCRRRRAARDALPPSNAASVDRCSTKGPHGELLTSRPPNADERGVTKFVSAASCASEKRLHLYGARGSQCARPHRRPNEPTRPTSTQHVERRDHDAARALRVSSACRIISDRRDTPPRESSRRRGVAFLAR